MDTTSPIHSLQLIQNTDNTSDSDSSGYSSQEEWQVQMEGIPDPGPLSEPEPPPSQQNDNNWIDYIMHNVNDNTINIIKTSMEIKQPSLVHFRIQISV